MFLACRLADEAKLDSTMTSPRTATALGTLIAAGPFGFLILIQVLDGPIGKGQYAACAKPEFVCRYKTNFH